MKNTLVAFFLMLALGANAHEFKMDFVNPSTIGAKYRVTIKMSAKSNPFSLRSNNLRFTYNPSELSNPKIVSEQFAEDFEQTTLLGSNTKTGLVSINTAHKSGQSSSSLRITPEGVELVTLEFDIVNSATCPNLIWKMENKEPHTIAITGIAKSTVIPTKLNIKNSTQMLRISPNPSTDNIRIGFEAIQSSAVNIILCDMLGKEIKKQNEFASAGFNSFNMNLNDIPSGTYFITVQSQTGNSTQKIIKQ